MARNDYISDNLVHIRDRLKAYSEGGAGRPGPEEEPVQPSAREKQPNAAGRAVAERIREAERGKRDLLKIFDRELEEAEAGVAERQRLMAELRRRRDELLELPDAPEGDDPGAAGNYFRRIENIRLGYIHDKERLGVAERKGAPPSGIQLDAVLSLSLKQWARIGFGLALPLIAAIFLAGLVVGVAILIGMGVW